MRRIVIQKNLTNFRRHIDDNTISMLCHVYKSDKNVFATSVRCRALTNPIYSVESINLLTDLWHRDRINGEGQDSETSQQFFCSFTFTFLGDICML